MNESSLREKGYMSSKEAGALLGYTHDYISRLCRRGKMLGKQIGREWFVTKEELDAFKARHEVELQEKKLELSKKFSRIRLEAEAKKRKDRESGAISVQAKPSDTYFVAKPVQSGSKKTISFSMPRELVAIAVLAVLVVAPSVLNVILQTPVAFKDPATVSESIGFVKTFKNSLNDGIQNTIYAQSTVVAPTAAVFSFMPYLIDGNWQFMKTIGELPRHTYSTWTNIGNGYLSLYVTQGELVYQSFHNLNAMGASVLWGYELLGQSFLVGSRDIVHSYIEIFNIESNISTMTNQIAEFSSNVVGGAEHVSANTVSVLDSGNNQLYKISQSFLENTGTNILAMTSTFSQISHTLSANASSLFDFKIQLNNHFDVRPIRVEK